MKIGSWIMAVFVVAVFLVAVSASALADGNSTGEDDDTNQSENETVEVNETADDEAIDDDAEDDDAEDNVTVVDDDEIHIINSTLGMKMRLLQLQKRVIQQEKLGQFIIEDIHKQGFDADTSNLEDYVAQMKDLEDRIAAELANDPVTTTPKEFVALKEEAITITFNFRKELYNILTPDQMVQLKKDIRDNFKGKDPRIDELDGKIRGAVRGFNSDAALRLMGKFGINDSDLRSRIESGNYTPHDLKDRFKADFKKFKSNRKEEIHQRINSESDNNKLQVEGIIAERLGLNSSDVDKILNDGSLTLQEKLAKLRLLAKEKGINTSGDGRRFLGPPIKGDDSDDETGNWSGGFNGRNHNGEGYGRGPGGR
jgi:hypothetical protein